MLARLLCSVSAGQKGRGIWSDERERGSKIWTHTLGRPDTCCSPTWMLMSPLSGAPTAGRPVGHCAAGSWCSDLGTWILGRAAHSIRPIVGRLCCPPLRLGGSYLSRRQSRRCGSASSSNSTDLKPRPSPPDDIFSILAQRSPFVPLLVIACQVSPPDTCRTISRRRRRRTIRSVCRLKNRCRLGRQRKCSRITTTTTTSS